MVSKTPMIWYEAIAEILETGPIVAVDGELGLVVTANGAYLNLYAIRPDGSGPVNVDCRAREKDMWSTSAADIWDEGKAWLAEIINDEAEETTDA